MLYIFHVDTGATITFDIKLALQSVSELKEAIERRCGVMAAHQVLLMSGGESLEPNARVCSYSAGTDTNPIYLFSKAAIESHVPPTPHTDYGSDVDLVEQINASLAMPATYGTLVARAQLAQQCCALAREQTRTCERLVHDQHLQQQGWAAVVANLEDITHMFQSRAEVLQQSFALYLTEREQHMQLLNNFNGDLGTLSKIPILPALRAQAEGFLSPDDEEAVGGSQDLSACTSDEALSLLKWISAKDNQSSLEQVAEQCSRGLEQFDERMMEGLKGEVNGAIDAANKPEMKEIKGLGERLFALEQLMAQTKRLVQEQGELAQGFSQNQTRASNLGDPSVLPDLCASHRRQLAVMMENHSQLRDIRRRCTKAKEELSVNIHHRLKWIMYVENKMMEVDGKLVMYHESLKRLRRHLEVIQQIHLAPQMYLSAVAEVVRRRTFSQAFLVWASNLACQLLTVHSEEIARRREFQNKFEGHFLNTLFPGLEDTPPPFATQAPNVFDSGLPKLTVDDMESLKDQLPDLADSIATPDLNTITQFFLSKSLTDGSTDGIKGKDSISMPVDMPSSKEEGNERVPMVADRVGFESETDTEEFEKIGRIVAGDSKLNSYDDTKKQKLQKQLEVGDDDDDDDDDSRSLSPSSSTSTNVSSLNSRAIDLNRSSSSSEHVQSYNMPLNSGFNERSQPLSPLAECAELTETTKCHEKHSKLTTNISNYEDSSSSPRRQTSETKFSINSNIPNAISNPSKSSLTCDGKTILQRDNSNLQQGFNSPASSPSNENINDFMGTEFYMDESLPSSLSEHNNEAQHQAIVSLLQENLGNTRSEVERLRSVLRSIKLSTSETLASLREELSLLRKQMHVENSDLNEITDRVRRALVLHSAKCESALREREQELTVDHELEMADVKKLLADRDEEIRNVYGAVRNVENELADREFLINSMRQKLEEEREEMRSLQQQLQRQLDEAMEHARIEKETALEETREKKRLEIEDIRNSLDNCRETIRKLEDNLAKANLEQQRAVKEATDKLQMEYKSELDTIRTRFKMVAMATSTMERSPSDSSLEKIERPDVIERVNHEAILSKIKEEMELEKSEAVRKAIEKENSDFQSKLDDRLREAARQMVEEVEAHRLRETALVEECQQYQEMIRRLTDDDLEVRQVLNEKVENLEEEKNCLQSKMIANRMILKLRENQIHELENERAALRQELSDGRLRMNQSSSGLEETLQTLLSGGKDDVEVSESKKVRLEASASESESLSRRLELLELDNKRLSAELRLIRESKDEIQAKVQALEMEKVRLEIELVKERSKRSNLANLEVAAASSCQASSSNDPREKDMTASVAIVSDTSSIDNPTASETNGRLSEIISHYRDLLIKNPDTYPDIHDVGVTFTSCDPGDTVLVVWDTPHRHYSVIQDSRTLYILNSECFDTLELWINPDGTPTAKHILGEVVDKQYCHAKKPENRYNVPKGTKFYRVRIKPLAYVP
ncbi:RB1-inducible coiled-coil protein 1 isoform X1 [Venturia canescens]|uniref:RB1-inducible coiled-coil protein 1 isoform X1 n=1 Tax=Venturia canescens TaxID=32260 RepID=UPI001C9BDC28|nr:RB1-inducible coiled-coil protein 1 isoform X1 [Venturia canescens]